jgi:restriction endonuclease S subunit
VAKTYIENIKLTAIRNKLFSNLIEKEYIDIFDVLTLSSGDFLPTQKMINGQYSVFGGGGITDKNHNEFNIQNETIGIGRVGARCGCVFKIPAESWVTDNALYANKIDANFDIEFLIHYLNFKNLLQFANTSAQPVISLKRISAITIPSLTLKEQKEIVKILNDIENGIIEIENDKYTIKGTFNFISLKEDLDTELTHQLDLIKQMRQAFLREAMQGKLVKSTNTKETGQQLLAKIKAEKTQLIADKKLKKEKELAPITDEEIPFEIPNHWAWCRLGEIGICKTGTTPSTIVKEYFGNDIPFIKPADITLKGIIINNEGLTFSGLKQGVLIPSNSLMMVCIGGSIGKSFFSEIEVSCNQQINSLTPLSEIKSIFLQFWLQSNYFQKEIWSKASGGTTPIVNRSKWEGIFIPLPPLHEQEQIVVKLEELMAFCDSLEQSIKESQGYNEQLLQQVLREALQGEKV